MYGNSTSIFEWCLFYDYFHNHYLCYDPIQILLDHKRTFEGQIILVKPASSAPLLIVNFHCFALKHFKNATSKCQLRLPTQLQPSQIGQLTAMHITERQKGQPGRLSFIREASVGTHWAKNGIILKKTSIFSHEKKNPHF